MQCTHFGTEAAGEEDVLAHVFHRVLADHHVLLVPMHVDYAPGHRVVRHLRERERVPSGTTGGRRRKCRQRKGRKGDLVALVNEDEEEIESRHKGRRQLNVLSERARPVVATADRVCSRQDGRASVQRRLKDTEGNN